MSKFGAVTIFIALTSNLAVAEQVAFECKTKKLLVRVIKTAADVFEYKAWNKPKQSSEKPDVDISQKGAADMQGTGPCVTTYYSFKKGDVEYRISDNLNCSESKPPDGAKAELIVKIKNQEKDHFWCMQ